MEPTPVYFQIGKKSKAADIFRNYGCPHYDRCLHHAARRDMLLDCQTCWFKDQIIDEFTWWLEHQR